MNTPDLPAHWIRSTVNTLRQRVVAIFVGLSIATFAIALWVSLRAQENTHIQQSIAAHAQQLQTVITGSIASHSRALERMANRWEVHRTPRKREWLADAALFIEHEPNYHAISWVDATLQMRWVFPVQGNQNMLNHNLAVEERHATALLAARARREVRFTRSIKVGQDKKGFAVYVPIFLDDAPGGFIGGLFHVQALLDTLVRDSNSQEYALVIFDGNEEIYSRRQPDLQYAQALSHEVPITLHNITWRMRIWPSATWLAEKQSALPNVVLAGGLLFAFMAVLILELMRTARLRAQTITAANQELHRHREHMEELVQERTNALSTSNIKLSQEIEQREDTQAQLRLLTDHLLSVRESERTRISREIHDELGQAMVALNIDVHWLSNHIPSDQPQLLDKAQKVLTLIESTVEAVRRIASNLRPPLLDDLGLEAAIQWYLEQFGGRTGITCELSIDACPALLNDPCSIVVFRIFQETLTNISRHANASNVQVTLQMLNNSLILWVKDNGRGISENDAQRGGQFGLLGMRERAQSIEGTVEITSKPGQGTQVKLIVPRLCEKCVLSTGDNPSMCKEITDHTSNPC